MSKAVTPQIWSWRKHWRRGWKCRLHRKRKLREWMYVSLHKARKPLGTISAVTQQASQTVQKTFSKPSIPTDRINEESTVSKVYRYRPSIAYEYNEDRGCTDWINSKIEFRVLQDELSFLSQVLSTSYDRIIEIRGKAKDVSNRDEGGTRLHQSCKLPTEMERSKSGILIGWATNRNETIDLRCWNSLAHRQYGRRMSSYKSRCVLKSGKWRMSRTSFVHRCILSILSMLEKTMCLQLWPVPIFSSKPHPNGDRNVFIELKPEVKQENRLRLSRVILIPQQ